MLTSKPKHIVRVANVSRVENFSKILATRVNNDEVTAKDVETIISEIHKRRIINFKRASVIQKGWGKSWESDLLDVVNLKKSHKFNNKARYILMTCNIFTKFLYTRVLRNKDGATVAAAMEDIIIESGAKPDRIQTDNGKEYYNKHFKELMQKYGIEHYSSYSTIKCSHIERLNRTFRMLLMRHLHQRKTEQWSDKVQLITSLYNNKYHRVIKMSPASLTPDKEAEVMKTVYAENNKKRCVKPKFNVWDAVRLSQYRRLFKKESEGSFTYEIYYVRRVLEQFYPCSYTLVTVDGQPILGRVYSPELCPVARPELYIISSIVDRQHGKCLVRMLGYDKDVWIHDEDITTIEYYD